MEPRRYLIRTFGCQMNEHDSERIAGLLDDDGLVPAESLDDADVVVLNTCCIRENADNKLYGNLGQLKRWKDGGTDAATGASARSSSPAAWPRRTARSSADGRRRSTSSSAPTTSIAARC